MSGRFEDIADMSTVTGRIQGASILHWSMAVKEGDVLKTWHDDGRRGSVYFWRVLKVCPRTFKVRGERGEVIYRSPGWFNGRVSDASGIDV